MKTSIQSAFFSFFQIFEEMVDTAAEVESDVDEEEISPVKSSDAMNATSTLHQFMEEHPQSFTDEDVLRMLENFKASHEKTAFH